MSRLRAVSPVAGAFALLLTAASDGGSALQAQRIGPRDVDTLPSRAPTLVAPYGTDSLQLGELRLPAGTGPFPVAVVIHGGCWTKGYATRRNTAALASALVAEGIATWNIEYRQMGDPGSGWPGTFQDIGAGVDYLRTLARTQPLDLGRVVVMGHSAGAHLALWVAARHRLAATSAIRGPDPLPVSAAVAIDGPGDLAGLVGRDARICGKPVIAPLMGGEPAAVAERYQEGSPINLLPSGRRQYLIASAVMTADEAKAYQTRGQAAGDSVAVLALANTGHFEVIAPGSAVWPQVIAFMRVAFGWPPSRSP